MRYFIDTNIFLRVFARDDEKMFKECIEFLELCREKEIFAYTGSLVLSEIVWTLMKYYKMKKGLCIEGLKSIIEFNGVKMIEDYEANQSIYIFEHNNIKFIDAQIASIKQIQNKEMVVVSYDKDFDKIGVKREEPGDIIKKFNK